MKNTLVWVSYFFVTLNKTIYRKRVFAREVQAVLLESKDSTRVRNGGRRLVNASV